MLNALAISRPRDTRRRFLAGMLGLASTPLLSLHSNSAAGVHSRTVEAEMVAGPGRVQLVPSDYPETEVWAYNATIPGPALRLRQGDRLRVRVKNALAESTTVHWHGIRLPNAMDGVPLITQPAIEPGGEFLYDFVVPDAGTFFYHPHQRSYEQVGRGLAGALIVDEPEPPPVDRDLVWVLGDWRLDPDASIRSGFGSFMDVSHNGRVGNTVTINGRVPSELRVRAGERIRLRLINAASARIFSLRFTDHRPQVIALDGQPVEPHEPEGGAIVLGPAMRADLILDMIGQPRARYIVQDDFYRGLVYELVTLTYSDEPPVRSRPKMAVVLPANPLSEPALGRAERHEVVFTGGMMGDMRAMARGMAWAVNGVSVGCGDGSPGFDPLFIMRRGRSYVLSLVNDTGWHHPIHLHGHSFRVLTRNGQQTRHREWLDTVMLAPRERAEIGFVADNPGDWMFHCHVLEHQAGGMMACIRVI
jgi:FtsP/CotA-like multicopper oxidase with cupredoxin domain